MKRFDWINWQWIDGCLNDGTAKIDIADVEPPASEQEADNE